jgi:hypothetical protein
MTEIEWIQNINDSFSQPVVLVSSDIHTGNMNPIVPVAPLDPYNYDLQNIYRKIDLYDFFDSEEWEFLTAICGILVYPIVIAGFGVVRFGIEDIFLTIIFGVFAWTIMCAINIALLDLLGIDI